MRGAGVAARLAPRAAPVVIRASSKSAPIIARFAPKAVSAMSRAASGAGKSAVSAAGGAARSAAGAVGAAGRTAVTSIGTAGRTAVGTMARAPQQGANAVRQVTSNFTQGARAHTQAIKESTLKGLQSMGKPRVPRGGRESIKGSKFATNSKTTRSQPMGKPPDKQPGEQKLSDKLRADSKFKMGGKPSTHPGYPQSKPTMGLMPRKHVGGKANTSGRALGGQAKKPYKPPTRTGTGKPKEPYNQFPNAPKTTPQFNKAPANKTPGTNRALNDPVPPPNRAPTRPPFQISDPMTVAKTVGGATLLGAAGAQASKSGNKSGKTNKPVYGPSEEPIGFPDSYSLSMIRSHLKPMSLENRLYLNGVQGGASIARTAMI